MGYTPEQIRWAIITAWSKHKSICTAAKVTGKSRSVVSRWVKRYLETNGVKQRATSGRKPALEGEAAKKAMELLMAEDCSGAEHAARQLHSLGLTSKKVHKSTVIRAAKKVAKSQGKPIHVVRGKPAKRLTADTKSKRLAFATANKSRSWANVMFTDRKKFLFSYPGAKVKRVSWVYKGSSSQAAAVNHPLCVNVYAGITKYGMTKCHIVAGSSKHKSPFHNKQGQPARNITSEEHVNVLKTTLLPEAARIFSTQGVSRFVLQQDNDPTHRVARGTVAEWNNTHASSVEVLDAWPPNSPDLNPIENVWSYVQAEVNATGCKTFEEFQVAVQDLVRNVPFTMITNLFRSMAKRITKVIEGEGEKTGY